MDNLVAEASDVMSPALDFGLPKTAQYVTDRRHVNYFPSGSNVYKSDGSGNLNIRFYITGEDGTYLDLSSIRLFANLKNNDVESHFLRPLSGLHGFFSRYRCTVGGQLVQDIDQYNRHCELYNSFKSADARHSDDIESAANPRWDDDWRHKYANGLEQFVGIDYDPTTTNPSTSTTVEAAPTGNKNYRNFNAFGDIGNRYTRHSMSGIRGKEYVRLGHKFKCGFLESNYYLPVRYAPLEIEVTLTSDPEAPIIKPVVTAGDYSDSKGDRYGHYFTTGDTSTLYELNSLIIRAEVVTLDSQVNSNITSHLLQGGSLKIVYPMYHTLSQTFSTDRNEINMNVVKSASKLNGMFITLYRQQRGASLGAGDTAGMENGYYLPDNYVYKRWNYFYNPMINARLNDLGANATGADKGYGFANKNLNISWQVQIHNKKYPEFESQSLAEHWYFLNRMLSYINPDQDACSITYEQYRTDKFIIGINFEKMNSEHLTGVNTKMSGLSNIKIKPFRTLAEAERIQEIFCHIISETVLEIRSDGSIVYD